jgi:leucyl-tRNA synthetase
VFSSFPTANKYGFQTGNVRPLIYGDVIARYERLLNKNVLYPVGFNTLAESSFIESRKSANVLNDNISKTFLNQMLKLGIGVNDQKIMDMRHDEYLSNLQLDFIELYERGYIEYKNTIAYQDPKSKKIYDYMVKTDDSAKIQFKGFVLKCGMIINDVIKDIKNLDLDDDIKEKLIDAFDGRDTLEIELETSIGTKLNISFENPWVIGGVTFILLNPDFLDAIPLCDPNELLNIKSYINKRDQLYVYSGNYCTNPLTGNKIPILISDMHNQAIYPGNPYLSDDDRLFALSEGFEVIDIKDENGFLINSDFLNGMIEKEANLAITLAFTEGGLAESKKEYFHKDILLSSTDSFGALFPFLSDDDKLYSLKDYLPLSFSVQFRPVLNEKCDIPGNIMSGTINSLFTIGMAPILAILYDEIGSNESMFSKIAIDEFIDWGEIKELSVSEDIIYAGILMPIIINNIIRREAPFTPRLIKNVKIIKDTYDKNHNNIKRSNNNMLDFDSLCESYSPDSIRAYFMMGKIDDDFIYDEDILEEIDEFIKKISITVLNPTYVSENKLDYEFFDLENKSKMYLNDNRVNEYAKLVLEFSNNIILNNKLTEEQLLSYLSVIYPLLPYLSEESYSRLFDSKYSIINEGWPC